ncbi:hypothetical protein [Anaerofustis sp.]|uniref:hypothetical protein n=1 Tax=Anaerofustis sp. TaxID=1872517 RepID=UPI0025BC8348|nr:hypothetical protein [Anaerofustis sp.]
MERFTIIVTCTASCIFILILLYFFINKNFYTLHKKFYEVKIKKFKETLDTVLSNLKNGNYPDSDTIEYLIHNINNSQYKENYYYSVIKLTMKNNINETTVKFINDINRKTDDNLKLAYTNLYSKKLENLIIKLNTYNREDEQINIFLQKCLNNKSKIIRNEALETICIRGDIETFAKAIITAGEKSSDFSEKEIFNFFNDFKNKKILLLILEKLKNETDNVKLKLILKNYLTKQENL